MLNSRAQLRRDGSKKVRRLAPEGRRPELEYPRGALDRPLHLNRPLARGKKRSPIEFIAGRPPRASRLKPGFLFRRRLDFTLAPRPAPHREIRGLVWLWPRPPGNMLFRGFVLSLSWKIDSLTSRPSVSAIFLGLLWQLAGIGAGSFCAVSK